MGLEMEALGRRRTLKRLTYGLYVVTARLDEGFTGATVSWLSQCSFEPPRIMLALKKDGLLNRALGVDAEAIVHVPGVEQQSLVKRFFLPPAPGAAPPLHGELFVEEGGLPALEAFPCRFRIRVRSRDEGGDHTVVLAEVCGVGPGDLVGNPLRMSDTPWTYGG